MAVPLPIAAQVSTALAAALLAVAAALTARGAARGTGKGHRVRLLLLAFSAAVAVPITFSSFSRIGSFAWLGGVVAGAALLAALWRDRGKPSGVLHVGLVDRALAAAALPVAAGVVLCGAAILFAVPANHDLAWLLYIGERTLDGARPYSDLIEVNPPLVVYLSAGAAWVGRHAGVGSFTAFYGLVLALAGLSAAASSWLWARLTSVEAARWAAVVFLFLSVPFAGAEFGQREHLLVLLYTPFLALAALRARRLPVAWPLTAALALAAAVGISIKPYFIIPWLLTEVYIALRIGWQRCLRRPEPWIIVGTGLAYVAIVFVRMPQYIQLATWGAELYRSFAPVTPGALVLTPRALLVVLALVAAFVVPGGEGWRDLRRLLALAALGLLLALLWQRKGWDYHWYPVLACALLSLALPAMEMARAAPARLAATLGIAALCSASALARAADPVRRIEAESYPSQLGRMEAVVREYGAGGPILILSTQVGAAFPLLNYTGLQWASRFNCLWFVPGLYPELGTNTAATFPYHAPDRMGPTERWVLHAYAADVRASKPTLILVDGFEPDARLRGFEPLAFLTRDPGFAAQRRRYRKLGWVGRYLVLRRADLPLPLANNARADSAASGSVQ